ncbi:MAG: SpoIIE family protein phosphatase [Spirochaetes bacterium]|nr:SpoIIE family protein phosphatase [Spirochaetota bacterium]
MKRSSFLLAALIACAARSFADQIDLTMSNIWAYEGFAEGHLDHLPEAGEPGWTTLNPTMGKRTLLVREMGLPGLPPWSPADPFRKKPLQVTLLIPFEADLILLNASDPAVYFAHVGNNWEVYLNGRLIRSELFLDSKGNITRERSIRGELVAIDKRYLKAGRNILGIRIVGDPTDDRTGLGLNGPYLIGRYELLSTRNSEYVDLMLIGIYFFFALYHGILWFLRPRVKSYLYYGEGTLMLSLYLLSRTHTIVSLVQHTGFVMIVEYASLFLVVPIITWFFEFTISGRVSRFARGYLVAAAILTLPALFLRQEILLYAFLAVSVPAAFHLVFSVFLAPMSRTFTSRLNEAKGFFPFRVAGSFWQATVQNPAGQLLFAVAVLAATLVTDSLIVNGGGIPTYAKYAYLVLVIGTAGILAFDFMGMWGEAENLNASLGRKVDERTHELTQATENQKRLNNDFSAGNRRLIDAMAAAERDMNMAVSVQRGFFPQKPPAVKGWDIAFEFRPASGVSGDLYDFYVSGDRLDGLLVGDVSGHGIASGLITVLTRSIFYRSFAAGSKGSLGDILTAVNSELVKELTSVDNYLTAALIRLRNADIEYLNAAHTDIILRKRGSNAPAIVTPADIGDFKGPPLGREGLETRLKAMRFAMEPGDALLVYTDCIIETHGRGGRYGMERLLASFGSSTGTAARETLDDIYSDFKTFVAGNPITDDLTLVLLVRK